MYKRQLLVCALSCIVFAKAKDWTQYVNPLMGSQSSFELSTGNTYPCLLYTSLKEGTTEFVGYDYTEYEASILRYRQIKQKNQTLYQIVLDYTPFYAESGGQVGDTGVLVSEFETIEVVDTKKENNLPIHITKKLPDHPEAPMMACVDTDKRAACAANHSATHLLDAALREVLGEHIEQKLSLIHIYGN